MSDILERLLGYQEIPDMDERCQSDCADAAREIRKLREEVATCRAAMAERIRCTTTRKGECDIINADRAEMQVELEKMRWERDIATEDRIAQNREFQQLTTELGIPVETTYAQGIRRFIGGLKDKIDAQQVTIGRAAQDINDANSLRKGYELDLQAANERISDMNKTIYRQRERISTLMHEIDELKVGNSLMSERIASQEHTAAILRADLDSVYASKAKLIGERDYTRTMQERMIHEHSMEAADAVAERCVEVCGGSKYSISNVIDVIASRDSVWKAKVDLADSDAKTAYTANALLMDSIDEMNKTNSKLATQRTRLMDALRRISINTNDNGSGAADFARAALEDAK